ncbi:exosortase K [Kordia sp. YSTF-M3]|uniref:Exosortase K n=1 Tax=Kordia aestuariivivens TaxID=2759037 RepID=A0ABR7QBQ6_9FLAO|nr:exosortase K [Kordia aestuariivivens]MBC8756001.1 exosortase K [Kordia aestuariivivens]
MNKTYQKIGFILGLILCLKALYSVATVNALKWFMYPMIPFVEVFTKTSFEWIDAIGFSSPIGIVIEKSCAGGNFFIICVAFLCFKLCTFQSIRNTILRVTFLGICSYLIMILANTTRIISAMKLAEWEWTNQFIDPKDAHLALGSILYIFILLIINHFISPKHVTTQTT